MIFTFIIWWKNHGPLLNRILLERFKEKKAQKKIRQTRALKKDRKRKKVGIKLLELDWEEIISHPRHLWKITHPNKRDFQQFTTMSKVEVQARWSMNKERKFSTKKKPKCSKTLKSKTRKKTDTFCSKLLRRQWRTHLMWLVIRVESPIQINWLSSVSKLIQNSWLLSKITPT